MKKLIALFALLAGVPVSAQTIPSYSYPSAGTPPSVILQCNDSYGACTPTTSTNPLKTSSGGSGSTADQIQGNVAAGATNTGNPVGVGCYGSSSAPTAVTNGQRANLWCNLRGGVATFLADANGTLVGLSNNNGTIGTGNFGLLTIGQNYVWNSTVWEQLRTVQGADSAGTGVLATGEVPTSVAAMAITPAATTAAASNLVVKASAGNLYQWAVTSGASAGYVMIFNATSAPADGAVTPAACRVLAANSTLSSTYTRPARFSTGITIVFSTTGCFNKTASATAYIEALGL